MDLARSLGADRVIDYAREDFTRSGERYDLIFAANGYHPILAYKRALAAGGVYVMVGGKLAQILQGTVLGPILSIGGKKKLRIAVAQSNPEDLAAIAKLLEARKIVPVIDRRYPFEEAVEAFRYFGEGHARGKVIITQPPASS